MVCIVSTLTQYICSTTACPPQPAGHNCDTFPPAHQHIIDVQRKPHTCYAAAWHWGHAKGAHTHTPCETRHHLPAALLLHAQLLLLQSQTLSGCQAKLQSLLPCLPARHVKLHNALTDVASLAAASSSRCVAATGPQVLLAAVQQQPAAVAAASKATAGSRLSSSNCCGCCWLH